MTNNRPAATPPPISNLLRELRLPVELARCGLWSAGQSKNLPQGDGHPVMVLPGFFADDKMLAPLVNSILSAGYAAQTWGLGRNRGVRRGLREALARRLNTISREQPATLVGWSLGGVFARELARAAPDRVRHVVTLGSPIRGHPASNNLNTLFRLATGKDSRNNVDWAAVDARAAPPTGVPCTAIHSKTDGIVHWECSTEPASGLTRNIEVKSSHFGLPYNPAVIRVVVDALANPPGARNRTRSG